MTETRVANLALQGGGAHGAFTWGVLDRLLKEPQFEIDGISAPSAGAMNAVVLAHGLTVGGREGAVKALADFWQRVARAAQWGGLQPSWYDLATRNRRPSIPQPISSSTSCLACYRPISSTPATTILSDRFSKTSWIREIALAMRDQAFPVRNQRANG
jgi:Patatin-like phospholipase